MRPKHIRGWTRPVDRPARPAGPLLAWSVGRPCAV